MQINISLASKFENVIIDIFNYLKESPAAWKLAQELLLDDKHAEMQFFGAQAMQNTCCHNNILL